MSRIPQYNKDVKLIIAAMALVAPKPKDVFKDIPGKLLSDTNTLSQPDWKERNEP
jgi:hypothetical protein